MSDSENSASESVSSQTSTRSMAADKNKENTRDCMTKDGKDKSRERKEKIVKKCPPLQGRALTIFEVKKASKMSYGELMDLITRNHQRHDQKSKPQAEAYTKYLLQKIQESEERYEDTIEKKSCLINQLNEEITNKNQKIKEMEEQLMVQCKSGLLTMANESQQINDTEEELTIFTSKYEALKRKFEILQEENLKRVEERENLIKECEEWKVICENEKMQAKKAAAEKEAGKMNKDEEEGNSSASQTEEEEAIISQMNINKYRKKIKKLENECQMWKTECRDWKEELKKKDKNMELIKQLFDHIKIQNSILSIDEKTKIEIEKLNKDLQEKEKELFELDIQKKSLEHENQFIKTEYKKKNEQFTTVEKLLYKYEEQIEIYKNQSNEGKTIPKELANTSQTLEDNTQNKNTYANKAKIPSNLNSQNQKNSSNQNNQPALILKKTTNIQRNKIRDILYREFKGTNLLSQLQCYQGRDPESLIIKADTAAILDEIKKHIEESRILKDIIRPNMKLNNTKKIILLGIPKNIDQNEILTKFKEEYITSIPTTIFRKIESTNSNNYQLVVEVEADLAFFLINEGRFLHHFFSFKTAPYSPVIRCSNCQVYGHSQQSCRNKTTCAYCAKYHKSETCPIKNISRRYYCINCSYYNTDDARHAANSSKCHTFQQYIKDRNYNVNSIHSPSP